MSFFASSRAVMLFVIAAFFVQLTICPVNAQGDSSTQSSSATASIESGIRLLGNKDAAGAKLRFSAAIRTSPRSADAFTWRGIAENQLKQYAAAIRDFEVALHINPSEIPAHYNLALAFIRTGQMGEAIEQLKIVVQAHPGVLEPEYNLAILLEQKHALAEAVEHLKAAYLVQPNDAGVIQHLIVDLLTLGRAEEAQPILETVQTEAPPQFKLQVGESLLEAGFFRQASALLAAADINKGADPQVDILLARAYLGTRDDFSAISLLKPEVTADNTGEVAYLLGLAYSDAGATQEATTELERATKLNPNNGRAFYHLGIIEAEEPGQLLLALEHLREAVKVEPGNFAYSIALGRVLLQNDQARDALALLQRVHPGGPAEGERDLLIGIAQITLSGPGSAVAILEKSIAENPSLALSHNMLGFCYLAQGEMAKAAASYAKASDLDPNSRIFAHGAAVAFDRSNNPQQALTYATRAAELPNANGDDYYELGKLLARAGRSADAIQDLNRAIALNPDMEEPYYLLARTYMQVGNVAQANEWVAKLKSLRLKHSQAGTVPNKGATPLTSSTLLQGAPTRSSESGQP